MEQSEEVRRQRESADQTAAERSGQREIGEYIYIFFFEGEKLENWKIVDTEYETKGGGGGLQRSGGMWYFYFASAAQLV